LIAQSQEDETMRNFDLSPLLRSSIGFDRFGQLFETVNRLEDAAGGYPPYNIEKQGDDKYRVTLAVAGFGEDELSIVQHESTLIVSGKGAEPVKDGEPQRYLHRGIARRAFERRFQLADYVMVLGAELDNGLLHVDLVREVPEAVKPRKIGIGKASVASEPRVIDAKAA
jgi:molecular chaperone IbpA